MSRLFEALQRSELGAAGFEFPLPETLVDGLVQKPLQEESIPNANDLGRFPSVSASVLPESSFICITQKESLGAEKFRFLGVRLRQLQQVRELKTVLITSTIPEEGKSMVSGNLAVTLARRKQQKVLLLEGDLRRPVLTTRLGLQGLRGLSEWLESDTSQITNIHYLEGPGFWLLPSGKPPANPLELMQSGRLSGLLQQLAAWFDWILIDSPPVLPLADTSVWARLSDGVLLVVREGTTEKRRLERGLQALDQSKLLGVVLNSCTPSGQSNYYQRYGAPAVQSSL
jgi:capsular exopolysaccharide synthesis family protein